MTDDERQQMLQMELTSNGLIWVVPEQTLTTLEEERELVYKLLQHGEPGSQVLTRQCRPFYRSNATRIMFVDLLSYLRDLRS